MSPVHAFSINGPLGNTLPSVCPCKKPGASPCVPTKHSADTGKMLSWPPSGNAKNSSYFSQLGGRVLEYEKTLRLLSYHRKDHKYPSPCADFWSICCSGGLSNWGSIYFPSKKGMEDWSKLASAFHMKQFKNYHAPVKSCSQLTCIRTKCQGKGC